MDKIHMEKQKDIEIQDVVREEAYGYYIILNYLLNTYAYDEFLLEKIEDFEAYLLEESGR